MRWTEGPGTTGEAKEQGAQLARALGTSAILGRLLWARGHRDRESAQRFLEPALSHLPNPFELKAIEPAVARIEAALRSGERICIYGDYDVDGVTSTALLVTVLRQLGGRVEFYVPHRLVEGYGLNTAAMEKLARQGVKLVISADCGVTAVQEIDAAARLGLEVVVIDHHTASQDLPRAVAILNPHQPGCTFPGRELAAVGVAFHLLLALRKRLREHGWFETRPEPNLREQLDLVALGTIADVVPLTGANRVLAPFGLRELSLGKRAGVAALKKVAQLDGPVTAGDVGFKLGPRINAAGRLDDAATAVRLLLTEDPREALRLAEALDRANAERQDLQRRIADEAVEQAAPLARDRHTLVVSAPGWHVGVVGIVASRLVERFHRPALVLAEEDGMAKGSGRSVEGFHLYDALAKCAAHLSRFGGHKHAAGVQLPAAQLGAFTAALEAEGRSVLTASQLVPRVRIDAELTAGELSLSLARELQRLGPFGAGNPEPIFSLRDASAGEIHILADKRGSGPGHLKLRVAGHKAIAFGLGDQPVPARFDCAFQLGVDAWSGADELQLKVKALRAGDSGPGGPKQLLD